MSEPINRVLERQASERNEQMQADIAAVLATAPGRRLLMSLLAKGGVWNRIGCTEDMSALRMAYANGRRDAAADVLGACNRIAADNVALAMAENNERVKRWNEQIETSKLGEKKP